MDRHRLTNNRSFGSGIGVVGKVGVAKDLFSGSGGSSRVSWCWCGFMGVSVDKFDTDLFGEGKFDLLAGGFSESSGTFLDDDFGIFDGWNLDGTFFLEDIALNDGEVDGFVDADLLGGGEGNGDWDIDSGDNGDIVGSFLGDFLAVVVSVSSMSVSTISVLAGLADGDHLDIDDFLEGDFDGFSDSIFGNLFVFVYADFLVDDFDGFNTDGFLDGVAVRDIDNDLDGESDIVTFGGNGWGTDLSDFSHINDGAVMFGFLITVSGVVTVSRGGVSVSWGMVTVSWGRGVVAVSGGGVSISRGGVAVCWSGVAGEGQSDGEESQDCECLHVVLLVV